MKSYRGRTIGFIRLTARRTAAPAMNAYDPAAALRVGADGGQRVTPAPWR